MPTLPNELEGISFAHVEPVSGEEAASSPIGVNSVLARRHAPSHRGKLALISGLVFLALAGVAAGALMIASRPDVHTPAVPPDLQVQAATGTPVATAPAVASSQGAPTAPSEATAGSVSTASTPSLRQTLTTRRPPGTPAVRHAAPTQAFPATEPAPGAGPSDAAPAVPSAGPPAYVPPTQMPAQAPVPAPAQAAPVIQAPPQPQTTVPAEPVTPHLAALTQA
jgi:hypothetical protein